MNIVMKNIKNNFGVYTIKSQNLANNSYISNILLEFFMRFYLFPKNNNEYLLPIFKRCTQKLP